MDEIKHTKAILVEGKDEVYFFKALFKYLNIDNVDIIESGGKERLKIELPAFLKRPGSNKVTSYAIFVDADNSLTNTFQSITALLKNNSQPIPQNPNGYGKNVEKQVGIYIMPGSVDNGMLEDLCLKTVADHPAMACLEQYFTCLQKCLIEKTLNDAKDPQKYYFPKNLSKSKALGFLAALYEPTNSVGMAATKGYWNFEHPSLDELKVFLNAL